MPLETLSIRLPTALTKRLRNLSRQHHVSLFSTLLSGWALLLTRWNGQGTMRIDARASADRNASTALSLEVSQDMTVAQLLEHTQSRVSEIGRASCRERGKISDGGVCEEIKRAVETGTSK